MERPDTIQNVLPIQYLCASYRVGISAKESWAPQQTLDLRASLKDNTVVVTAFIHGTKAPAGTKLRIFNPNNSEEAPLIDDKGQTIFIPAQKGLYLIRLD